MNSNKNAVAHAVSAVGQTDSAHRASALRTALSFLTFVLTLAVFRLAKRVKKGELFLS
jgi:hypothetical protein